MDLATLIGLAVSFGLIALALLLGGDPLLFADLPALLIVLGGTIGATLVNYPIDEALRMLAIARHAFKGHQTSSEEVLNQFLDLSNRARREGLLALEPAVRTLPDPFMRKGLQLTVDGLEPEAIEDILRCEMENMETRHESGAAIFAAMGTYAPALGLIGTVIGLVQMLKRMNDPSTIGPAMSVALITTFYGALLSSTGQSRLPASGGQAASPLASGNPAHGDATGRHPRHRQGREPSHHPREAGQLPDPGRTPRRVGGRQHGTSDGTARNTHTRGPTRLAADVLRPHDAAAGLLRPAGQHEHHR